MRLIFFLAALCLLLPAHAAERVPPAMRLGDAVQPRAYELDVRVDPRRPDFSGRVAIDVDIAQPLDFFWLNGTDLKVQDATVVAGGRTYRAKAVAGGEDFIGLQFAQRLPAGGARLTIAYRGHVSTRDSRGLFHQRDLGESYVYTQFEALHARRAIPSFDEPHWKTPWTVTLTVPRGNDAFSNAPVQSQRDLRDGWKQVRFATTAPLPTYLVAFAAGPFEVVDGGRAGQKQTPLRFIVPKGRAAEARYASQVTGRLLALLEDYFGMPYPFEKLDSLAIPVTVAFSAMENPGLITYASHVMLAPAQDDDEEFHHRYASVAAHEMAHQWFGDLVTMQWWDDVWLNESFATWMSRKIVRRFEPAWSALGRAEGERQWAFHADRLASARQVRQPVATRSDMEGAFDGITYAKGGVVLAMYEQWLGEQAFRDGVRRYLQRHRFGNAQAPDFFRALGEADPGVAEGFSSFVLQPGLPIVDVALDCGGGQPALELRQQRFAPTASATPEQRWRIPFCVRAEGQSAPQCTMLAERSQRLVLQGAARCPAWVLPNPGGVGYYVSRLAPALAGALPVSGLSEAEAVALMGEQSLLANSGGLPIARLLQLAQALARDPRPPVVTAAAKAVEHLPLTMMDRAERTALAGWTRTHFGARAQQLGWLEGAREDDEQREMRRAVVPLVADVGGDPALRAQARELALAWLADPGKALGGLRSEILRTAARDADAALFEAYVAALRIARDPSRRYEILTALGTVRDPALLAKSFALGVSPGVEGRMSHFLYEHAAEDPDNAGATFAFVQAHYDALAARLPDELLVRMPRWHTSLCTPADRDAMRSFFSEPVRANRPGAARALTQSLETVDLCVRNAAWQRAQGALVPTP